MTDLMVVSSGTMDKLTEAVRGFLEAWNKVDWSDVLKMEQRRVARVRRMHSSYHRKKRGW